MTKSTPPFKPWLQLILGLLGIYLLAAVLLPLLSRLPMARTAIETIEEQDIDPRALFYTESAHAVEAGRVINERMKNERMRDSTEISGTIENK